MHLRLKGITLKKKGRIGLGRLADES